LAQAPDVVVVDFPHAAVLLPQPIARLASILFTHNVEAEIFERHAAYSRGIRRLIWRAQARKMDAYERAVIQHFDTVIAVSELDASAMRNRYGATDVRCIDTGVDLKSLPFAHPHGRPRPLEDRGTIVFTGAMDSLANIDGVRFFMEKVWPLITNARPRARTIVVGRNPPKDLVARTRSSRLNWTFTGFVKDARPHITDADVSVIPLRVGSGTRMKAFEAMALGKPVVSTTVGVEGLGMSPDKHYLVADTPLAMADAILRLLDDPDLYENLAISARALLEAKYSWTQVASQFNRICVDTLSQIRRPKIVRPHKT